MGCRDDKQYFIDTTPGQIERRKLTTFLARWSSKKGVFRRFLSILSVDPCCSAIQNYFRSRRTRQQQAGVQENLFRCRIWSSKFRIFTGISRKVTSASVKWILGGPAGGSALERASPVAKEDYIWLVETTSNTL